MAAQVIQARLVFSPNQVEIMLNLAEPPIRCRITRLVTYYFTLRFYIRVFSGYLFPQVMCDTYTPAGDPIPTNKRYNAAKVFSNPEVVAEEPWYDLIRILLCPIIFLSKFGYMIFHAMIKIQVWDRARVHFVTKRCEVAVWMACWRIPRTSGNGKMY